MKKILIGLFLLLALSGFSQPIQRNSFTTNAIPQTATNVLYQSPSKGSDSNFQWGNPTMPVKSFTNALWQAQLAFSNSPVQCAIVCAPEVNDYTSTKDGALTVKAINVAIYAWGTQFKLYRLAGDGSSSLCTFSTNCNVNVYGGTYDLTFDYFNNKACVFSSIQTTNVYMFGVKVIGVVDNFFWTQQGVACSYTFEYCDFSSAWDMNVISFTDQGTNSVFTWRYCTFLKNKQIFDAVTFKAIDMSGGGKGILRLEHCSFSADEPDNTNSIVFVTGGRTNYFLNNAFSAKSTVGTIDFIAPFGGMPANRPRYIAVGNSFFPMSTNQWTDSPNIQYGSSFASNIFVYGTGVITNLSTGVQTNTMTAHIPTNVASLNLVTTDFTLNTFFTNTGQRAWVQASIGMNANGAATIGSVNLYLDQDGNGAFEQTGISTAVSGIVIGVTNMLGAYLQPNARFMFTNTTTGAGAGAFIVNGSSQWVRF